MSNNFKNSSKFLKDKLISDILNFKNENNLFAYELLYEKERKKNDMTEPYYGNSKSTATQVISKLKNNQPVSDSVLEIISSNVGRNFFELFLGIKKIGNPEHYIAEKKFLFFFTKVLEDAFLSDDYFEIIINVFKDYVPFTKKLSMSINPTIKNRDINTFDENANSLNNYSISGKKNNLIIRNNTIVKDANFRKILLNDSEFTEIFWEASIRLVDKINLFYNFKDSGKTFELETINYFKDQNRILMNLQVIVENYFISFKNIFLKSKGNYLTDLSFGSVLYDLMFEMVNTTKFDKEEENFSNMKENLLLKEREQFSNSIIDFSYALQKIQIEMDEFDKVLLKDKYYKINNLNNSIDHNDELIKFQVITPIVIQCLNCRFSNEIFNFNLLIENISKTESNIVNKQSIRCRHCDSLIDFNFKIKDNLECSDIMIINGKCLKKPSFQIEIIYK
ncbi:hypothetical protein [Streptococcus uberis]|uniref:hypothetical protein n=1 Tax=Streptococcus uberis TaxID=1349 RepID=UPI0037B74C2A